MTLIEQIDEFYLNPKEFKKIDQRLFLELILEHNLYIEPHKLCFLMDYATQYKENKKLWQKIVINSYMYFGLFLPMPYFRYNKKFKRFICSQYKQFLHKENLYNFLQDFQYDLTPNEIKKIFLMIIDSDKKSAMLVLKECGFRLPVQLYNNLYFIAQLKGE